MRTFLASLLFLLSASFSLVGCANTGSGGSSGYVGGPEVGGTYYTLCNLHAEPTKQALVSINYIEGLMIPIGSEVTIDSINRKKMTFTDTKTGVLYNWSLTKHTPTSLAENLDQFFGPKSSVPDPESYSEKDTEGIRLGKVLVGMTKAGVLAAVGPPPEHATPSQTLPAWTYWKNKWARRIITFGTDDVVTDIQG